MDADESLDGLIAYSISGVHYAENTSCRVEEGQKPVSEAAPAGEAPKELQVVPEQNFSNLASLFHGEPLHKLMTEALETDAAVAQEPETVEFLQGYVKKFDSEVQENEDFGSTIETLFKSMLSPALLCEPLRQITDALEPWLKEKKGLKKPERQRFEKQLELYRKVIDIYKTGPDPLPDDKQVEVKKFLEEAQGLGGLPEDVMRQVTPEDSEQGTETFEDFMRSMNLGESLRGPEQDLLKKLSQDPEDLQRAIQEVANTVANEDECKQQ